MYDLRIDNGRIYTSSGLREGYVGIEEGKIVGFKKDRADEVIDAKGMLVLPGVIDFHVHFRDPGLTYKEDFFTGSRAAAHGGVTTVVDMPNTKPAPVSEDLLARKIKGIEGKSLVDFVISGGVAGDTIEEIGAMGEQTLTFGELFMSYSFGQGKLREENLGETLSEIKKTGKVAIVHCEDETINMKATDRVKDKEDPISHCLARPVESEISAVKKVLKLAKETGVRLHICHLSTKGGLELVYEAKREGVDVTCEATPHHLFLTEKDMDRLGAYGKMNPPLRTQSDRMALWGGIISGAVDMVATDHAPHTRNEKEKDFWEAPSGVPGVETSLPLLLTQLAKGNIDLNVLVRIASTAPAKRLGLYPRKGIISTGSEADIVIVDPKYEWKLSDEYLLTKCNWSPFEGMSLKGMPIHTILRGEPVMLDSEIINKKIGRHVCEDKNK
jgi:dihydroorotase